MPLIQPLETIADVILSNGNYRLILHPREKEVNAISASTKQQSTFREGVDPDTEINQMVQPISPNATTVINQPEKPFDPNNIDIFNYQFEFELNNNNSEISEKPENPSVTANSSAKPTNPNMPDRMNRKLEPRTRQNHELNSG